MKNRQSSIFSSFRGFIPRLVILPVSLACFAAGMAGAQTIYDVTSIGQPLTLSIGSSPGQITFTGSFNIGSEQPYDFTQISALFRGQASSTGTYAAGSANTLLSNADSTVNSLSLTGGNSLISGNLPYDMLGAAAPLFVDRTTGGAVEVSVYDAEEEGDIPRRLSINLTKTFDFTTITGDIDFELASNFPQGGGMEVSLQIRQPGDLQVNTSTVGLRVKPGLVSPDSFSTNGLFRWDLMGNTESGAGTNWTQVNFDGKTATFGSGDTFLLAFDRTTDFTNVFWTQNRSWQIFDGGTIQGPGANSYQSNANFTFIGGVDATKGVPNAATQGSFSFDPETGTLNWTAIPEPSTAMAGLLLAAGLLRRRRSPQRLVS